MTPQTHGGDLSLLCACAHIGVTVTVDGKVVVGRRLHPSWRLHMRSRPSPSTTHKARAGGSPLAVSWLQGGQRHAHGAAGAAFGQRRECAVPLAVGGPVRDVGGRRRPIFFNHM